MNLNKSQFRFLVATEILLGVASIIANTLGESSLPLELQNYMTLYYEDSFSTAESLLIGIAVAALISNIGIFFFANWARNGFTVSCFLSSAGMVFDKAIVQTNIEIALSELSLICAGFIIACMYLTNINKYFTK